jgi:hypothetical protein
VQSIKSHCQAKVGKRAAPRGGGLTHARKPAVPFRKGAVWNAIESVREVFARAYGTPRRLCSKSGLRKPSVGLQVTDDKLQPRWLKFQSMGLVLVALARQRGQLTLDAEMRPQELARFGTRKGRTRVVDDGHDSIPGLWLS